MLLSKSIRATSIDRPREIWRVNGLIGSRLLLLQMSILEVMKNNEKEKRRRIRD